MNLSQASLNPDRDRFRPYALDGAVHYFHPRTATHVRMTNQRTRGVRRQVPRVIMFGITNACNRSCSFCSRGLTAESLWTVDSAFQVLRNLAAAGALEVAFGGGEPFAFPGFAGLVARLYEHTPLALNVTTNGDLINHSSWSDFTGRFGQVRVSIYDDTTWRRCADVFSVHRQLWGANVLVDDQTLSSLPKILSDLSESTCHDVSILSYVGEAKRTLSTEGRRVLSDIVRASPIPCRVSVCFGEELALPRLFFGFDNAGDCGAGSDFVTVTSDQRVQACSFQERGFPGSTASEILHSWRTEQEVLEEPSPRTGCARLACQNKPPQPLPEIAIWQGFSGNNSGECILVAKFQTVEGAQSYLAELLPGWRPPEASDYSEEEFSAEWKELFAREQVASKSVDCGLAPDELVHIGKSVIATGYGVDDNFPEVRALAWKRGAFVVPGGIHVHESSTLFAAIRARDSDDVKVLSSAAEGQAFEVFPYGHTVFLRVQHSEENGGLANIKEQLLRLSGERPLAAELFYQHWTRSDILEAQKCLGETPPTRQRLWIQFPDYDQGVEKASAFAATLTDQTVYLGSTWLMVDPVRGRKHVAVLAHRRGANVTALEAEEVSVEAYFWRPRPLPRKGRKAERRSMPALQTVEAELNSVGPLLRGSKIDRKKDHNDAVVARLLTSDPGQALSAMETIGKQLGLSLWPHIADPNPVAALLRRLRSDLTVKR